MKHRRSDARPETSMRSWALIVGSLFLVLCSPHAASAQDWPTRNVTVVVPLPAGTSVDSIARLVMQQVGQQVRQSFIVENRPGAGGTLGTSFVAKAAPDGYSTLLVYGAAASAAALYVKLPYDTLADITPVAPLGQQPLVVVAPPGRFKNLADLVAQAKARPGGLNFSTPGVGSAAHLRRGPAHVERRLRRPARALQRRLRGRGRRRPN